MTDATGSTATASVVCVALADFFQRPVAEQARLKARLESLVARAIEPLAGADRIVADTAGRLIISGMNGPAT